MVAHARRARLLAIGLALVVVAAGALALARASSGAPADRAGKGAPAVRATSNARACRAATGSAIPKPPPPIDAARRRHARADAAVLLGRIRLPAGAEKLTSEPTGDGGTLACPESRPAPAPVLVDEHTWWRVPGSVASVLAYLRVHPPRGSKLTQSGSQGPVHGTAANGFLGFSWPPVGRVLGVRQLLVQAVDLTDGETGMRVDAQVQWIIPRPVSERIPRGVHEIDVTRAAPREAPSISIKVVAPHQIRALIAMVDALPIAQPGTYPCPALPVRTPVVTFTFRARDGGTVLATASEAASAREPTTACDPMSFSIRGHPQASLLGGAAVVHNAGRLLGVHLQTAPGPGVATGVVHPG